MRWGKPHPGSILNLIYPASGKVFPFRHEDKLR
jgi:hypothetical protein